MSIIDGVKNVFKGGYDDDYEYDEDYDDEYDDEYEDDDKSYSKRKLLGGKRYKDDDLELEDYGKSADKSHTKGKVVPIKTGGHRGLELVVIRPESMEDASEITDTLLTGKAVVLNLEGIHVDVAQRLIDYSAGSCYAMRGNLQKITNFIFLVTPPNVDISGDIPELVAGGIDIAAFGKTEQKL